MHRVPSLPMKANPADYQTLPLALLPLFLLLLLLALLLGTSLSGKC